MADPVRTESPFVPHDSIVTVPPQGASASGPYAARELGRAVAEALGLPFAEVLARTDRKRLGGVLVAGPDLADRPDEPGPVG